MYINENMGQKIDTIIASLNVSDNPLNRSFKVFMLIAMISPKDIFKIVFGLSIVQTFNRYTNWNHLVMNKE